MADIKSATSVKGDTKPMTNDDGVQTDDQALSSVGGKNISDDNTGGGDGSARGDEPNTYVDEPALDQEIGEDGHVKK